MRPSPDAPQHGYKLRLMSPLGNYPEDTFLGTTSALVTAPDICFSIVQLHRGLEHWDFSEVDILSPSEVPLLAALTLAVDEGERYVEPYPTHQAIYLRASSDRSLDPATVKEAREWIRRVTGMRARIRGDPLTSSSLSRLSKQRAAQRGRAF